MTLAYDWNYFYLNPCIPGLFSKSILVSSDNVSGGINPASNFLHGDFMDSLLAKDPETFTPSLAKSLKCPFLDPIDMIDCLRSKTLQEILQASAVSAKNFPFTQSSLDQDHRSSLSSSVDEMSSIYAGPNHSNSWRPSLRNLGLIIDGLSIPVDPNKSLMKNNNISMNNNNNNNQTEQLDPGSKKSIHGREFDFYQEVSRKNTDSPRSGSNDIPENTARESDLMHIFCRFHSLNPKKSRISSLPLLVINYVTPSFPADWLILPNHWFSCKKGWREVMKCKTWYFWLLPFSFFNFPNVLICSVIAFHSLYFIIHAFLSLYSLELWFRFLHSIRARKLSASSSSCIRLVQFFFLSPLRSISFSFCIWTGSSRWLSIPSRRGLNCNLNEYR